MDVAAAEEFLAFESGEPVTVSFIFTLFACNVAWL
jgi:hypothetical protein